MSILTRRMKVSGYFKVTSFLVLAFASCAAYAGTCAPDTSAILPPVVAIATLNGSVTVGRDIPVGATIYQATFNRQPQQYAVSCQAGITSRQREYVTLPHPKSSYVDPNFGPNVYETGVPGVGVVVWYAGKAVPTQDTFTTAPGVGQFINISQWFDVSFIKTGPVSAGQIRASDLPLFDYTVGDNRLLIEQARFTGAVNFVARTCTTPDVNINLGDFTLDVLKGVGTTTSEVEVPIDLLNCPAFFGKFRRDRTTETGVSTSITANTIDYRVDPTSTVLVPAAGVVALKPGGATGIGVQVKDTNKAPLPFGTLRRPNVALTQVDGASYRISLWANYYQVSANPTPGKADATVTMTLVYQ